MLAKVLKVDYAAIKKKAESSRGLVLKGWAIAEKQVISKVNRVRNRFFKEFRSHKVTQEIAEGNEAANISGTLGGYGNLYSFIGFDESNENPILALEDYLQASIEVKREKYSNGQWRFRVTLPTLNQIEALTPMKPWSSESWVTAVESYIPNIAHYMHKEASASRSGMGIQIKGSIKNRPSGGSVVFHPTPYLTPLLENLRANLQNLD